MYSDKMLRKIKRIPNIKKITEIRDPKPANGTPITYARTAKKVSPKNDRSEKNIPMIGMNLSGVRELANIPLMA